MQIMTGNDSNNSNSETRSSKRCLRCKKKTVMLVSCRCKNSYCLQCRMPEDHGCTFDLVKHQLEILRLENPVVSTEKIEKI